MTSASIRSPLRKAALAVCTVALALSLTACESARNAPKQTAGGLLGGVGGAVVGAQFGGGTGKLAATAAGALLGAWLGSEVGKSLDNADRAALHQAQTSAYSAPVGQPITWNNPQSGHSGYVTPTRDGTASDGSYCREFQNTVTIDGKTEHAYGTACRQSDGTWKIVQ
ncbi:RT0821/Lpp0805 family surface protein [Novispirillum itersonii]|uniref:RT0821/Lpp0805 family surface protein n=1 Tax=Novispirillum itersonii TaxID=189 RepID=UPI000382E420|nr:RT0821/Lpp0805 family surface protein [Novispirillum itersonii]